MSSSYVQLSKRGNSVAGAWRAPDKKEELCLFSLATRTEPPHAKFLSRRRAITNGKG